MASRAADIHIPTISNPPLSDLESQVSRDSNPTLLESKMSEKL